MGWIFVVIYVLMWLLVTFIIKYVEKKCGSCGDSEFDDELPSEVMGLFWPIIVPLAAVAGIGQLFMLIGRGMDKLIDKITKNTK